MGHVLVEPPLHQTACADFQKQIVGAAVERIENPVIHALRFVDDHQEWAIGGFLMVTFSAFRIVRYPRAQSAAGTRLNDVVVIAPDGEVTEQVSVSR